MTIPELGAYVVCMVIGHDYDSWRDGTVNHNGVTVAVDLRVCRRCEHVGVRHS